MINEKQTHSFGNKLADIQNGGESNEASMSTATVNQNKNLDLSTDQNAGNTALADKRKIWRGIVEMLVSMTMFGTVGLLVIYSGQPVTSVVFWRCVFGAGTLLVICLAFGLFKGNLTKHIVTYAVLGGVALVLNWLLLFSAYSYASISISTVVYNTQPFILVMFGVLFMGEKLTANKMFWLVISFIGVVFIVMEKPQASYIGDNFALGIVMALGAAFFWAVNAIFTMKLKHVPPHVIAFIQVCVGIIMLLPFVQWNALPNTTEAWTALIILGVVQTGLVYIISYGAVQKLPTHLQGALSFIYPLMTIVVDFMVFGQRIQPIQILGMAAILLAAIAMTLGWKIFGRTNKAQML